MPTHGRFIRQDLYANVAEPLVPGNINKNDFINTDGQGFTPFD